MNRKRIFGRWFSVFFLAGLLMSALSMGAFAQEEEFDEYWGNRIAIPHEKWQVTASVNPNLAKNAIDNNLTTAWTAVTKAGDYFQVDLGEVQKVNRLEWYAAGTLHEGWGPEGLEKAYPQKFRIDVSVDGTNWTTVVDQADKGAFEASDFLLQAIWKPVDARYIRVVQTEDQASPVNLVQLLVWREGQPVGVTIYNHYYFPSVLLIPAGTTVEWIQLDWEGHTVTQGDESTPENQRLFNSSQDWSLMEWGETFSFTFKEEHAGSTIRYYCIPHPIHMVAWVKVVTL